MLTTLIPRELDEEYRARSRNNMQDAANALQWHLYEGLCQNLACEVRLINAMPVGSFPQYYTAPFIKKEKFGGCGTNVGFCNVKLIRNGSKRNSIMHALKEWCAEDDEPKTLIVYSLSHAFVEAVSWVKKKHPDLTVCAIVADLPNMSSLSSKTNVFRRGFSAWSSSKSYNLLPSIDCFVLLTDHMATYMHLTQPYMVMEGIAPNASEREESPAPGHEDRAVIMYSGTLHKKFGILHLVEAFRLISDDRYQLVICGAGDSEAEIKQAAKEDPRIIFMGQLHRDEVLKLQKKATVLVNPRLNNEDFTKYSFPSKTMEYLASGVPVVAYKLDGIPDEYDPYIIYPADDSAQTLADTMQYVADMRAEAWSACGCRAKRFVMDEKNKTVQTKRIVDFLEKNASK